MAKLYSFGLLERFKAEHCPDASLRFCSYTGPANGSIGTYMWGGDLIRHLGGWEESREESLRIAATVGREHALEIVRHELGDVVEQLGTFQISDMLFVIPPNDSIDASLQARMPKDHRLFSRSAQQRGRLPIRDLSRAQSVVCALAFFLAIACAVLSLRKDARPLGDEAWGVLLFHAGFLLANATTTGLLSNPADRYQGRVMPLVVTAGAFMIAAAVGQAYASNALNEKPERGFGCGFRGGFPGSCERK